MPPDISHLSPQQQADFMEAWNAPYVPVSTDEQQPDSEAVRQWLEQNGGELRYLSSGNCDWDCTNEGSGEKEGSGLVAYQTTSDLVYVPTGFFVREDALELGPNVVIV